MVFFARRRLRLICFELSTACNFWSGCHAVELNLELTGDVECFGVPVAVRDEINRHESQGKVLDYYSENPPKVFLRFCLNVSRFMCAIEVVRGMSFGQTRTQFCALPHEVMPSAP